MKFKKILFVGAIVGAMGIGAMIGPVVSFASTDDTPVFQPGPRFNANQDGTQQYGGMGLRMGQYFAGTMRETTAGALGVTVDELYELRTSGKSIEEIAGEKGVTTDELLQVLVDARTAQLEQLVSDEVITEDQKVYILERMEERMGENFTRTECGPNGRGNGYMGQGTGPRFNSEDFQPGQGRGPRWSR